GARKPMTIASPTRTPMSIRVSDAGSRRWINSTRSSAMPGPVRLEASHGLAIQPLHHRRQELHRLVEILAVDDAHVAVNVARGHAHRDTRHAFAAHVDAAGVGAAPLHGLELERQLELR